MKWVAALLMILNVIIFLGISDRQVESRVNPVAVRPDVNRESMLLLKEIQPPEHLSTGNPGSMTVARAPGLPGPGDSVEADLDETNAALIATRVEAEPGVRDGAILDSSTIGDPPVGVDDSAVPGPAAAEETGAPSLSPMLNDDRVAVLDPAPDSALCYRVGPFKESIVWAEAKRWAAINEVSFQPVRSQSRELRAVRVYVGPFPSISAAQANIGILEAKELDYFVYLHASEEARISLGYFTQEELATKFVDYLSNENISARSQPEYRTLGPFDWMDIETSAISRQQLQARDWGDDQVQVAERECESVSR